MPVSDLTLAAVQDASGAWKSAMARARGDKVLDNPALLKRWGLLPAAVLSPLPAGPEGHSSACRAVKREQKGKEKRAQAWQQRISKQDTERSIKQNRYHCQHPCLLAGVSQRGSSGV